MLDNIFQILATKHFPDIHNACLFFKVFSEVMTGLDANYNSGINGDSVCGLFVVSRKLFTEHSNVLIDDRTDRRFKGYIDALPIYEPHINIEFGMIIFKELGLSNTEDAHLVDITNKYLEKNYGDDRFTNTSLAKSIVAKFSQHKN